MVKGTQTTTQCGFKATLFYLFGPMPIARCTEHPLTAEQGRWQVDYDLYRVALIHES